MMTRIPFFREVVLMAFECQHCGFRRDAVAPFHFFLVASPAVCSQRSGCARLTTFTGEVAPVPAPLGRAYARS